MASQVEAIKWVPGTPFLVDGFRFQHPACRAFFLTHMHSDHTTGLSRSFSAGEPARGGLPASSRPAASCAEVEWLRAAFTSLPGPAPLAPQAPSTAPPSPPACCAATWASAQT